ncbi:MAG: polyprenyl synthetase family protein [Phycisphaerales bacterium JB037]
MQGVAEIPEQLEELAAQLSTQLLLVAERFDAALASDEPAVAELIRHLERYRGKMLRPTLVLLSGLASTGATEPPDRALSDGHRTLAAVCEMVHMATLVHDDVLDEASVRRGGKTVNHLRGNEAAVMLGDLLIAGAYRLCASLQDQRASLAVASMSMEMCVGELTQIANRDNLALSLERYERILDRKTGALIGTACELGAHASGAPEPTIAALGTFGRDLGIAFQIQDDLLDLIGTEQSVGKTTGVDLAKGKLTLPVILWLEAERAAGGAEPAEALLRRAASGDPAAPAQLRAILTQQGFIERARAAAAVRIDRARAQLATLPPSPARDLLAVLADAVITRSK